VQWCPSEIQNLIESMPLNYGKLLEGEDE
jgi:hypothetical protein